VVAFSLVTHELGTNATNYGALSSSGGELDIRWNVLRDAKGENIFELEWKESGGPSVAMPTRNGFGRAAIELSLANTVDGAVSPSGLICRIDAPVSPRLGSFAH
jgi:two-component sensor histidine kinase